MTDRKGRAADPEVEIFVSRHLLARCWYYTRTAPNSQKCVDTLHKTLSHGMFLVVCIFIYLKRDNVLDVGFPTDVEPGSRDLISFRASVRSNTDQIWWTFQSCVIHTRSAHHPTHDVLDGELRSLCRPGTFFSRKQGRPFHYGAGFVDQHIEPDLGLPK